MDYPVKRDRLQAWLQNRYMCVLEIKLATKNSYKLDIENKVILLYLNGQIKNTKEKGSDIMNKQNSTITKLAQTAVLAALCYVAFTFLQIKIPVGDNATSLHIGNAVCVLGALLIGGFYGGLAGAIGMTIGDLLDPVYIYSAPKTFVLKLCIGLITGLVAHHIAKINEHTEKTYVAKWSTIAAIAGLSFNVIADPIVGYFYKRYLLGQPQELASALLKISRITTLVNAVVSVILVSILYNAVRPALIHTQLLNISPKK